MTFDRALKWSLVALVSVAVALSVRAAVLNSTEKVDLRQKNQDLNRTIDFLINLAPIRLDRLQEVFAEQNVFRVVAQTPFGFGGGTGYLLNSPKYGIVVMTNKHICDMNPEGDIFLMDQDTGARYYTKTKRKGVRTDLCELETPTELLTKYRGLTMARYDRQLQPGEMLYVYGHPALRKLTASRGPFLNSSYSPLTEKEDSYLKADRINVSRADVAIYPGSSGSPVLDKNGLVVGTIFAYETDSHIGLFIPLQDMYQFLEGNM